MICMKCRAPSWLFAWNVKPYFLWTVSKVFKIVVCYNFTKIVVCYNFAWRFLGIIGDIKGNWYIFKADNSVEIVLSPSEKDSKEIPPTPPEQIISF